MRDRRLDLLIIAALVFFLPRAVVAQSAEEELKEENPHIEMTKDEFVCLDCHTLVPKKGETSPVYFLFDLPSENCLGCHDEMTHSGVKEHLGKYAKPLPGDENGKIACFSCHDPHPQGVIEGRAVYESEVSKRTRTFVSVVAIPDAEERLHKKVASEAEKEVYLRLPVVNNELCTNCHKDLRDKNWRENALWDKFIGIFSY